jgi:hypothetical protein
VAASDALIKELPGQRNKVRIAGIQIVL